MKLAIIGCGLAGRGLGRVFARAGHEILAVTCRTKSRAEEAAGFVGAAKAFTDPPAAVPGAEVILLCVPDDAISGVAAGLPPTGAVVAHVSGGHGSEILKPHTPRGAMHPLRSFGDPARAADEFDGTFCAVDGEPEAVGVLEALAKSAGGKPAVLKEGGKTLYHAGAVLASNYVVALFESALRLFEQAGVSREQAHEALTPLIRGTASNIGSVGLPEALTGPIERGDVDMVRRHLDALGVEERILYTALARVTVQVALAKKSIDDEKAARIFETLER